MDIALKRWAFGIFLDFLAAYVIAVALLRDENTLLFALSLVLAKWVIQFILLIYQSSKSFLWFALYEKKIAVQGLEDIWKAHKFPLEREFLEDFSEYCTRHVQKCDRELNIPPYYKCMIAQGAEFSTLISYRKIGTFIRTNTSVNEAFKKAMKVSEIE